MVQGYDVISGPVAGQVGQEDGPQADEGPSAGGEGLSDWGERGGRALSQCPRL